MNKLLYQYIKDVVDVEIRSWRSISCRICHATFCRCVNIYPVGKEGWTQKTFLHRELRGFRVLNTFLTPTQSTGEITGTVVLCQIRVIRVIRGGKVARPQTKKHRLPVLRVCLHLVVWTFPDNRGTMMVECIRREGCAFLENIGFSELILIFVAALVVFGPKKLPELGRSLGQGIREFKKATQSITEEVTKAAMEEIPTDTAKKAAATEESSKA